MYVNVQNVDTLTLKKLSSCKMLKLFNWFGNKVTHPQMKEGIIKCQKVLKKIPNINAGGCGIAVYSIFLYLKKNNILTKDFQIVSLNPDHNIRSHNQNTAFVNKECKEPMVSYHFGFTLDGGKTIWDCTGNIAKTKYELILLIPHKMSEIFCKKILNENYWNPCFSREENVPVIESKLKIKIIY